MSKKDSSLHLGVKGLWIFLESPPTCLNRDYLPPADLSLLRYPIVQTCHRRFRNFNLIPITYAFRPRLRGRLTLSGLAFLRKPWAYGEQVSHLFYRYSCRHRLFRCVHRDSRPCFVHLRNAPLPSVASNGSQASVQTLSPEYFRRRTT